MDVQAGFMVALSELGEQVDMCGGGTVAKVSGSHDQQQKLTH